MEWQFLPAEASVLVKCVQQLFMDEKNEKGKSSLLSSYLL